MAVPRRRHPLLLFLAVLYGATTGAAAAAAASDGGTGSGDALLDLLQRVQSVALRALGPRGFDPKLYVDMPLAAGVDLGAAAAALPTGPEAASRGELDAFLAEYLAPAGSDLVAADPPDLALPEPRGGFLPRVERGEARAWAREVHALWRNLTRRVAPGVADAAAGPGPPRHTLLPLPGRAVVPGSDYRELYYWVVRGLLVSKMYETAKEGVLNLLYLVERYGFVLNSARSYYINRRMSKWPQGLPLQANKEKFYHQVASAAESGWDFSSRWMRNPPDMTTLATTFIIPVDLNTFMYKMERD